MTGTSERLILGRLKGHARQWYDTRPRVAVTWQETKEALKQQFRKSVPFSKLFKEAALYESYPGQALGDYCFQKLSKMRKLDIEIPDKYLIDAVIDGITDENVARTIRSAQHRNANELYAYMTTLENFPSKNERKTTLNIRNDRKDRALKSLSANPSGAVSDENIKPTGDKAAADNIKSKVECYNCGKSGHIARKCRMPRVECERYNRLGHRANKCTIKKDVNAVQRIGDMKSNLYERTIFVDGHKINGLIDSGSGRILLRVSVVEKYKMVIAITSDNVLRGFAGQSTTSNRSVSCRIKIMDASAQVNTIVVPDEYLSYDILVGRDFLEKEDIVTIKRGKNLIFKQLPAMDDKNKNIINVNFFDIERKSSSDDIIKYTGVVRIEARQQCMELLQHFRDCISFTITDLGKMPH